MNRKKLNKIMDLADEALAAHGFECIEAEWSVYDQALRLYIDREGGVDMEACVEATRLLREWDGVEGKEAGSYTLEVSSPGIERPLRRQRHFEQFIQSEIFVHLTEKFGGRKKGAGRLRTVSQDGQLVVDLDDGEWTFPIESIHKAHLIHKWDS